ncbi:molybdopterin-dependent oxidoreductase [Vandammella animalimorsus]|nr:molybdopterin-dependent oxidoreductase [Vandammella animalimorsus]
MALCIGMTWGAVQAQQNPAAQTATPQVQPLSTPAQHERQPNADPVLLRIQAPWHDALDLTEQDLLALPQVEVRTSTSWTDGVRSFQGPLLRDVLKLAGRERDVQNMHLLAKSLNDYHAQIPASDAWKWNVIIALRMNGHPLSRRDKGPLWIIYPRDSHAELKRPHYDHRWPWQLHLIELHERP